MNETQTRPDDSLLPYRAKESTFRLYEPFISRAIKDVPTALSINPAPLRPTTYAARLRDAIVSFRKYGWEASFTRLELDAADLSVRHTETYVVLGTKLGRGRSAGAALAVATPNSQQVNGLPIDRIAEEHEIVAFCVLLSGKLLSGPIILHQNKLTTEQVSKLESQFDIVITSNDQDHTIII